MTVMDKGLRKIKIMMGHDAKALDLLFKVYDQELSNKELAAIFSGLADQAIRNYLKRRNKK